MVDEINRLRVIIDERLPKQEPKDPPKIPTKPN
jgi:hypothetical protein